MNISRVDVVLSAELLEEKGIPLGPYEDASQPGEVPVVVCHADDDDEDENDEEDDDDFDDDDFDDDFDDDEVNEDDPEEDEDQDEDDE